MGFGMGGRGSATGIAIATLTAESSAIVQTFQPLDSIRRKLSTHRSRALHSRRSHLRSVQPVNERKQLRAIELDPMSTNPWPTKFRFLERIGACVAHQRPQTRPVFDYTERFLQTIRGRSTIG
ncbi:hypothetical protein [Bradyrhizobium acaciae]|uniref:hypothetical protein n=1 Tax=Bradyrhizobium acaciae TaxID=2683706 RepID=UPI001E292AB7|nr:hypothetical protein [Bradyrhizobium acaciae]MCC8984549.1 hypothetical protein [Bradyrhizobium acaciae]